MFNHDASRVDSRQEPGARRRPSVAGILIGGQSRRMGSPKALIAHPCGPTYVEYVARIAARVADEIVLLGSPRYALPPSIAHLDILPDRRPDAGPLAGLEALLTHAGQRWTYLISCDLPRLTPSVLRRLSRHISTDVDAVVYRDAAHPEKFHCCCACYHGRILTKVTAQLSSDDRSLHHLLGEVNAHALDVSASEADALKNVNTKGDLRGVTSLLHASIATKRLSDCHRFNLV